MRRFSLPLLLAGLLALSAPALAHDKLVEPSLHVAKGGPGAPHVALTLDACSGVTDMRILSTLVEENIPATIFVTGRWLRRNHTAFALMKGRPDLFQIENHGLNHLPAVDFKTRVYGIEAAGSPAAVAREVQGGEQAIIAAGAPRPHWYRGATARYSPSAITQITAMGYRIAGYSVNGDAGASLMAGSAERRIKAAKDGDVIIAHINHPGHSAGAGVARAIRALKAKGFVFVRLDDGVRPGRVALHTKRLF